jgi:tetratricopeptide (TPR) repeat protein
MKTQSILFAALLVACGGSQKSGTGLGKGNAPPPPPTLTKAGDKSGGGSGDAGKPSTAEPAREISKSAREDYKSAYDSFMQAEKAGWNESACRSSADRFSSVARSHPELIEAQFMIGLSYSRCAMNGDAEKAWQEAARAKGDPKKAALAVSSLGALYFKAGKPNDAKKYWEDAINAEPKLVGAHIGIATIELEQMRKINNVKDATWKKLDDDARFHLSNALGVDSDSVEAYTQFGFVFMEGWQQNKNRLDLANTLLDEGKKRLDAGANGGKYAPLHNAYGLLYLHRGALNQALAEFQQAVTDDPRFVEARKNVGFVTLGFRKYDTAMEMFSKVLELTPNDYEAMIGLGIAQRGTKQIDAAEATYKKARDLDKRRGAAYFNLGVLYKDFKAAKQPDPNASIAVYKQAKEFFQASLDKLPDQAEVAEAKNNISDCDKVVVSLQKFMEQQAKAQQMEKEMKEKAQQQQQQPPAPDPAKKP